MAKVKYYKLKHVEHFVIAHLHESSSSKSAITSSGYSQAKKASTNRIIDFTQELE